MRYRVLGEVDVVVDGAVRAIGSANQRLVLGALLAHPNRVVTTDALIEALWKGDPPPSALPTLRTYISRLRRLVGDALAAEPAGYRLVVESSDLDALAFERYLDEAAAATPAHAVELLDEALAIWRGPPFGEHADVPLIVGASRRLDELRADALEARVAALLASGAPGKAAADATALLADHSLREGVWVTLVDSLVASNRSAEATRQASRARAALADAGLEPGPALRAAESRALGIDTAASSTAAVQTVATAGQDSPAPSPVPSRPPTSFVGRDRQLLELADLLETAPLVTLVGPGGVGKTRLAVELAALIAGRHRLGVRLVELGALTDPDDVAGAIASVLGLTVDRVSVDEALASAGDLDVLAVIDNAEHVTAATARVVELLTRGRGPLRVVVTSRERLAVAGENVRAVRPLSSDDAGSPAQVLLRDRSLAAGANVDDLDPLALTRVTRRLDGLPLAIEMAAAQLTLCSPAELLDTLDRRIDELTAASTRVPVRHQSLAALIDWSVDRLEPADIALLHRLTVFAGTFTAGDVVGVLGDGAVAAARRLTDRSLVTAAVSTDRTTFRVLYVVRERIRHRLGPPPEEVRSAHARWYLEKARSAVAELMSPRELWGRDALNKILDELRAAHHWATEHDRPLALALCAVIHPFAQSSLNDDVLAWADRLIANTPRPGDDLDDVAVAMASSATRAAHRGDHLAGAELARRALAIAEHVGARLPALETLADAMLAEGELDESDAAYRQLVDDARRADSAWYWASGASGVSLVAAYADRPPSRDVDPTSFDLEAPPSARAWLAFGKAELVAVDDPIRAEALLRRALSLARAARNRFIEGVSLVSLASTQCRIDAPAAALATFRLAIQHWLDAADRTHQVTALRNLAVLLREIDLPTETAQLLGGLAATHVSTYGAELANLESLERWLDQALPRDERADARARGARLSLTELARWSLDVIDGAACECRNIQDFT